jgi:CRISPR/Cas system-associated exonuclease Cas4 (RecB family)
MMRFNPNDEDRMEREDYPFDDMLTSYTKSTYAYQPEDEDKILRVTKSSLGTYGFCPKQYFYQNVLKLETEEKDHHVRGSNVHDVTQYFFDEIFETIDEILEEINSGEIDDARDKMYEVVPQPPEPYLFGEPEQIQRWVDWQFDRLLVTKGEGWFPVGNEVEVHGTRVVDVDGVSIPIHMRGFIDRIFEDGNGGFALMELKTGKWKQRKNSDMRAEMQFYKMMIENSPHSEFLPITHWGWEFPGGDINEGDGAHWDYEPITSRYAKNTPAVLERRLKKLVKSHLDKDFPAERSEWKCVWCDFLEICPAWTLQELE